MPEIAPQLRAGMLSITREAPTPHSPPMAMPKRARQTMSTVREGAKAEANSKAEQVRGEGDAERNRLFAEAYGKDADFFAFYRSMSAYETSLKSNDTRFLLRPDSDFFRFFGGAGGKPAPAAAPAKP